MGTIGGLMRGVAGRLSFANVAAALALFMALGGSAWALTSLHRDSIEVRHLDFPLGGAAAVLVAPVEADGTYQKVGSVKVRVDDGGGRVQINGLVEAENGGNSPATVRLRLTHIGWPIHCIGFETTVLAGQTESAPISLTWGKGVTPGTYKIDLEALAPPGVTFRDRSLNVSVLPPAKGFSFSFGSCL